MQNKFFNVQLITRVAIVLAMAMVLHVLKLYHLPQGGSITLGSMVPILLMALYYGPAVGFLTGFLFGLLNLMMDPYILHPFQVLLDYPLPFMALGLAGYFKGRPYLGTIIGVSGRFICHYLSGVVFFASYAPKGMSPYLYSFVVNGMHMAVEGFICLMIIRFLPLNRIFMLLNSK